MPTDLLQQIICNIKIRRAPTRHDNIDFKLVITKTSEILPLSIVVGDRGYDSEENHIMVREKLGSFSVIPARNEDIPIWKTYGRYRKQMKRGYSKTLYHHRNKDETIISVIKRLFGEHVTSRSVKTQNRELSLRCIAYNMHRLTNLVIMMISTEPWTGNSSISKRKLKMKRLFLNEQPNPSTCWGQNPTENSLNI